jgi:hypothetical protein
MFLKDFSCQLCDSIKINRDYFLIRLFSHEIIPFSVWFLSSCLSFLLLATVSKYCCVVFAMVSPHVSCPLQIKKGHLILDQGG